MNIRFRTILAVVIGFFLIHYTYSVFTNHYFPTLLWSSSESAEQYREPRYSSGDQSYPDLSELWQKWDSNYYLSMAMNGYRDALTEEADPQFWAYYPLYSFIVKAVTTPLGINGNYRAVFMAGVALSTLFFAFAIYYLQALMEKLQLSGNRFWSVLILLFAFPSSYFFLQFYPEALFLLLSVLVFYLLFSGRHLSAAFALSLALVTKPHAITLLPAFFLYLLLTLKDKPLKLAGNTIGSLAVLAAPVAAFYGYVAYLTGDFWKVLKIQSSLHNTTLVPFSYFWRYFETYNLSIAFDHIFSLLLLTVLCIGMLVSAIKITAVKTKLSAEWLSLLAYGLTYFWMLSAITNMNSIYRYTGANIAFFLLAAVFLKLNMRNPLVLGTVAAVFAVLHFLFFNLFLLQVPAYGF